MTSDSSRKRAFYEKVDKAYTAFHSRRWKRARSLFEGIVAEAPDHDGYLNALATCEYHLRDFVSAIQHVETSIALCPVPSKMQLTMLARAYRKRVEELSRRDPQAAIATYRELIGHSSGCATKQDLKKLKRLLGESATDKDLEFLASAEHKVATKPPFWTTSGEIAWESAGTVQTRHQPSQFRVIDGAGLAWIAGWAKPRYLEFVKDGVPIWKQPLSESPRALLVVGRSIAVVSSRWQPSTVFLDLFSLDGSHLTQSVLEGGSARACVRVDGKTVLVSAFDYDANVGRLAEFDASGRQLWKNEIPRQRPRIVGSNQDRRWIVAINDEVRWIGPAGEAERTWAPAKVRERVRPPLRVSITISIDGVEEHPDQPTGLQKYFDLLKIPPTGDRDKIKRAFLAEVKKWHPDVSSASDATEVMQRLNRAYEVLRSAEFSGDEEDHALDVVAYPDVITDALASEGGDQLLVRCGSGRVYRVDSTGARVLPDDLAVDELVWVHPECDLFLYETDGYLFAAVNGKSFMLPLLSHFDGDECNAVYSRERNIVAVTQQVAKMLVLLNSTDPGDLSEIQFRESLQAIGFAPTGGHLVASAGRQLHWLDVRAEPKPGARKWSPAKVASERDDDLVGT